MSLPTIGKTGTDTDATISALLACTTGHFRYTPSGPADVIVTLGTADLGDALDRAGTAVVVLNPALVDAATLGNSASSTPIILSEFGADALGARQVDLDPTREPMSHFVDMFTVSAPLTDPFDILFAQVRLLRAFDHDQPITLGTFTHTLTGFTGHGLWGEVPITVGATRSLHHPGATTVTMHRKERIDTVRVPDADTSLPTEITSDSPGGVTQYSARYDHPHRDTLLHLLENLDDGRPAAAIEVFLSDAATIHQARRTHPQT